MSRDITQLHPYARMLAEDFEADCKQAGYNIKITDCVRTKAEQNKLGASRTKVKYPYSFHNWGLAFDICQNDPKCPYPSDNAWWEAVIAIGEKHGLEAGGHWTGFKDRPHFQLNAYGTCEQLIRKYGSPNGFFKHKDFQITTPKTAIVPTSSKKKIMWLQVRLNCFGAKYHTDIDGVWGADTTAKVKKFYEKFGKKATGKVVGTGGIKKLK